MFFRIKTIMFWQTWLHINACFNFGYEEKKDEQAAYTLHAADTIILEKDVNLKMDLLQDVDDPKILSRLWAFSQHRKNHYY